MRFLHPPRTGGSTLSRSWGLGKDEYKGHKPPCSGDGWTYGFTRNPWDRVVSLYHLAHRGQPRVDFASWVFGNMRADGEPGKRRFAPHITQPTLWWLRDADWVGYFETRGQDLQELAARLGRPVPTSHENASAHRHGVPYWRYYAGRQDLVDFVGERYRQDVDVFGYRFVAPEGVFLWSLPGSGTRFVYEELLRDRPEGVDLRAEHPHPDRDPEAVVEEKIRDGYRVVVAVRDPMLSLIRNANQGYPVGVWDARALAMWQDDPRVLFLRVDCAEEDRRDALRALALHTGVAMHSPVTWGPREGWTTPDRTGLRAAYLAGERRPELAAMAEDLRSDPEVVRMYTGLGYELCR